MALAADANERPQISPDRRWGRLDGRRALHHVSLLVIVAAVLTAVLAPVLAPHDPATQSLDQLRPPGGDHPLGTDALGRDVLSRLMFALRTDLMLVIPAAGLPMMLGTIVGCLAAYYGGLPDAMLRWTADVFQGLPVYVLLIAIVAALGRGTSSLLIAFTTLGWIVYARLARTEVRRVKERNFVSAAYLLGHSRLSVLVRHVVPNATRQTLTYFVFDLGVALQTIAVLSFFNLGVPAGTPELGSMVADAQILLRSHLWLAAVPGLVIITLGVSIASIGDRLADRVGGGARAFR